MPEVAVYNLGVVFCLECGAIEAVTPEAPSPKLGCVCKKPMLSGVQKKEPEEAIYCSKCLKRFVPVPTADNKKLANCPFAGCGVPNDLERTHLVMNVVHQCRCGGQYAIAFRGRQSPVIRHKNPPCKVFKEQRGGYRFLDWVKTGAVDGARPLSRKERRREDRQKRRSGSA